MNSLFPDLLFATCPDRDICRMRHLITPDQAHKAIICQRCGSRFLAVPLTTEQAFPKPKRPQGHQPKNTPTQSTSEWTPTPMKHTTPPAAKAAATPAPTPATPAASDTPSKGRSLPPIRNTPDVLPGNLNGDDLPPLAGPPPSPPVPQPNSRPVAAPLVSDSPPNDDLDRSLAEMRARVQLRPQQNDTVRLTETARPRPKARDEKEKDPSGVSLFVARIVHSVWTKVALAILVVFPFIFFAGRLSAPVTTVTGSTTTPIDMEQVTSATKKGVEEALDGGIRKMTETQVGELKKAGDEVASLKKSLTEAKSVLEASQANEKAAIAAYEELRKWVDDNHPAEETASGQ